MGHLEQPGRCLGNAQGYWLLPRMVLHRGHCCLSLRPHAPSRTAGELSHEQWSELRNRRWGSAIHSETLSDFFRVEGSPTNHFKEDLGYVLSTGYTWESSRRAFANQQCSQAWWLTPAVPAHWRLWQEDPLKLKPAWDTEWTLSQNQKQTKPTSAGASLPTLWNSGLII